MPSLLVVIGLVLGQAESVRFLRHSQTQRSSASDADEDEPLGPVSGSRWIVAMAQLPLKKYAGQPPEVSMPRRTFSSESKKRP